MGRRRPEIMNLELADKSGNLTFMNIEIETEWTRKTLRRRIRAKLLTKSQKFNYPFLGQMSLSINGIPMKRGEKVKDFWRRGVIVHLGFDNYDSDSFYDDEEKHDEYYYCEKCDSYFDLYFNLTCHICGGKLAVTYSVE